MDIQEGSYGGRPGKDGLDAVDTLYANTRNNPIEDIESHYPLRVTRYELNVDTGGAGAGAAGSARSATSSSSSPAECRSRATARCIRRRGSSAARDGTPGRGRRSTTHGESGVAVPSKFPYRAAQAGDRLCLVAPSGGGYGPAAERDPRAIREDIADGVLSPERARELYGFEE